jgi:hypothetical protein
VKPKKIEKTQAATSDDEASLSDWSDNVWPIWKTKKPDSVWPIAASHHIASILGGQRNYPDNVWTIA